ncbi:hypothetical protein Mapa_005947 [Marchantia paleacea]|nr:hypothetical protein Mapa_005947 [Marchantia paleacea]
MGKKFLVSVCRTIQNHQKTPCSVSPRNIHAILTESLEEDPRGATVRERTMISWVQVVKQHLGSPILQPTNASPEHYA